MCSSCIAIKASEKIFRIADLIFLLQVKTVFVDGLPASWDEDRVRELLKKYGEVEKIELARNMPSAKRRDFGFVTFDTHDAAVTCAKSINNAELGEGDNKVSLGFQELMIFSYFA
jgi:RNA recognition motif-containing protein